MEQSTGKQSFSPSWPPPCSSEGSASYSQSASSAVISPACDAPCESSGHTLPSPLQEHDYIGLAEISSSASFNTTEQNVHVPTDDEPDLRLGLGPSAAMAASADGSLHPFFELKRDIVKDPSLKTPCSSMSDVPEVIYGSVHMPVHSSSMKKSEVKPMCSVIVDPHAKSTKRPFSEMMVQVVPDVRLAAHVNTGAAREEMKPGAMLATGQVRMMLQMPDVAAKPLSKHPQMVYWVPSRAPSRHSELAHTTGSQSPVPSGKAGDIPRMLKNNPEHVPLNSDLVIRNVESTLDDAPPAKEQVVGWPPVRSYRRSAIAARLSRPCENEGDVQSTIFVKVNMDGIPIGRKIDLNAYSSYEELLSALEEMFHSPHIGESVRFLHARDFVLTYEDKEGDWMLVGDVPWSMFVNTVKRLRIVRGCDSSCLGSSTSKNFA